MADPDGISIASDYSNDVFVSALDLDTRVRDYGNNRARPYILEYGANSPYATPPNEFDDDFEETEKTHVSEKMIESKLLARPLHDYDATDSEMPSDDSFIVVNKRLSEQRVLRFSKEKALYIFGPLNPIRSVFIKIASNQLFEFFIIITIFVNCIFMALNNPPEIADQIFMVIYTMEMIIKIMARGFVLHKYAYLRDKWNWLDFFVVILGYLMIIPELQKLSALRTLRVLRALKAISTSKGLKAMINTLIQSMKNLRDVLILSMFFLLIMALIGLQLFIGVMRQRCVLTIPTDQIHNYYTYVKNTSLFELFEGEEILCRNDSNICGEGYTCYTDAGENPDFTYTNFDDMGWSLVAAFQLLTADYWENIYNKVIATMGPLYMVYFVFVIYFCSFYLLNLVLAVITDSYDQEMENMNHEDEKLERERKTAMVYPLTNFTYEAILILEEPALPRKELKPKEDPSFVHIAIEEEEVDEEHIQTYYHFAGARIEAGEVLTGFEMFRYRICQLLYHKKFELFIMSCIILNTLALAWVHHNMDDTTTFVLAILNYIFTAIFTLEMILKLIGLGPRTYVKFAWNKFDGFIVIISLIDLIMSFAGVASKGTSVFRACRLFRVFKLAQSWKTMAHLIGAIYQTLPAMVNITIILIIIVYIFAVVGMQLFGPSYTPEVFGGDVPRWNFNDFIHAFLMVFRFMCGEWVEPLWDCMIPNGQLPILFFIPAFIICNFIIFNLFLALLLNAFADEGEEEAEEELAALEEAKIHPVAKKPKTRLQVVREMMKRSRKNRLLAETPNWAKPKVPATTDSNDNLQNGDANIAAGSVTEVDTTESNSVEIDDCFSEGCMACCPCFKCGGESSFCTKWLNLRYKTQCLVQHRYFEAVILILICVSSLTLAFEDIHLDKKPNLKYALEKMNVFFAVVFLVEMLLKLMAFGVIGYLKSSWNLLDGTIVIISLLVLFFPNLSAIRSLRTLRALRPLRAISRFEGMRVVVNALVAAIPGIGNVCLVCLLLWLIFSILGVQFFKGKFYRCLDADGEIADIEEIQTMQQCLNTTDYRWENTNINFDNTGNGLLALLQLSTFEGWMELMDSAIDINGLDLQPSKEANLLGYLYFIVFIMFGAFLALNLFIGVIIDNFARLKSKSDDDLAGIGIFLTDDQKEWVKVLKSAVKKKPKKLIPRPGGWRGKLYDLVTCTKFEVSIMMCIVVNSIFMMMTHYNQSEGISKALEINNLVFTVIFTLEAVLKLIAFSWHYFKDGWNIFDIVIVILSIFGMIAESMKSDALPIKPNLLRVIRVFRVGRMLRFLEFAHGIRNLLNAMIISIPALFNIGTLLALIMFIFAIIGMTSFGKIKKHGTITSTINFEDFGNSMLLLFRLSTAAGWNDVLEGLMLKEPDCDPNYYGEGDGDCGTPWLAVLYMILYIIIVAQVVVNMYIAIILENYNLVQDADEQMLKEDDFDGFYEKWSSTVPGGKQFMPFSKLSGFIDSLDPPLRIPKPNKVAISYMDIPIKDGDFVHCYDILKSLVKRLIEKNKVQEIDPQTLEMLMDTVKEQFKKNFKNKKGLETVTTTRERYTQMRAAILIQREFKNYKKRKDPGSARRKSMERLSIISEE